MGAAFAFLRLTLDRLADLLRLLPDIHRPLLHAPLRIVEGLLACGLAERVEHPRQRREAGEAKGAGGEEGGDGAGDEDGGGEEDGAEDDEERGGDGEAEEAPDERDTGEAEEAATDREESEDGEHLARRGAVPREEALGAGVVAVGLLVGVDLDLARVETVTVSAVHGENKRRRLVNCDLK